MTRQVTITLDDDTAWWLDATARRLARRPEEVAHLALVDYLVRADGRAREATRASTARTPSSSDRVEKADVAAWLAEL